MATKEKFTQLSLSALADPDALDQLADVIVGFAESGSPQDDLAPIASQLDRIIDQMSAGEPLDQPTDKLVFMTTQNRQGMIIAANAAARAALDIVPGANLQAVPFGENSRARLNRFIGDKDQSWCLLRLSAEAAPLDQGNILLAYKTGHPPHQTLSFIALNAAWPQSMIDQAQKFFKLSRNESEITRALALGLTPSQIASQRDRSIETIKAQIKAIINKTESRNQADLLQLLAAMRRAADLTGNITTPASHTNIVQATGNRRIDYVESGDPNGRPLIFVHGSIAGRLPVARMMQYCADHQIRWISVARPGYGETDAANSISDHRTCAVSDISTIVDQLQLTSYDVLGYSVGAVTALDLADQDAGRIGKLTIISGVTANAENQVLDNMPLGQRAIATASTISPHLVRVLVKLGMRRFAHAGADKMGELFFGDAQADLSAMRDPVILNHMLRAYQFHSACNLEAFVQDTMLANGAWQNVPRPHVTTQWLHGTDDRTVPPESAQHFAQKLGAEFTAIADTGHLLPLVQPHLVARALTA